MNMFEYLLYSRYWSHDNPEGSAHHPLYRWANTSSEVIEPAQSTEPVSVRADIHAHDDKAHVLFITLLLSWCSEAGGLQVLNAQKVAVAASPPDGYRPVAVLTFAVSWVVKAETFSWEASSSRRSLRIYRWQGRVTCFARLFSSWAT